ncbi:hypothetical protein LTS10_000931 [Elasticomyces elasticus]|nr:hypothetical protein LTS10_000931 [Elasticomyces elasticus]
MVEILQQARATIVNGTELSRYKDIRICKTELTNITGTTAPPAVTQTGRSIRTSKSTSTTISPPGLAELSNTPIRSLADLVNYNIANVGTEGGTPGIDPAFGSGQDGFLASLETGGIRDETY